MIRALVLESLDLLHAARGLLGGPCCRFTPSCSAYTREAVLRLPLWRAAGLSAARLARCHPFHPGGYDPVPDVNKDS